MIAVYMADKRPYTLGFRITDEMRKKLKELAERKTRSVGGQAEHLLKMAMELFEETGEEDADRVREKLATYRAGSSKEGGQKA